MLKKVSSVTRGKIILIVFHCKICTFGLSVYSDSPYILHWKRGLLLVGACDVITSP